jgi:hypothetical protein
VLLEILHGTFNAPTPIASALRKARGGAKRAVIRTSPGPLKRKHGKHSSFQYPYKWKVSKIESLDNLVIADNERKVWYIIERLTDMIFVERGIEDIRCVRTFRLQGFQEVQEGSLGFTTQSIVEERRKPGITAHRYMLTPQHCHHLTAQLPGFLFDRSCNLFGSGNCRRFTGKADHIELSRQLVGGYSKPQFFIE